MRNSFRAGIVVTLILLSSVCLAQSPSRGKVVDSLNAPMSSVSVTFLNRNSIVASSLTDRSGSFNIPTTLFIDSFYTLKLTSIGYQDLLLSFVYKGKSFDTSFCLRISKDVLEEVKVTGKKAFMQRRSDRYILDIENSPLATGNSGLETLQKSPGIWVDNNDNIRIKGNQDAVVMINDVVQRMSGDQLSTFLKSIRSENISRIEVIHNPPSEMEAAGSGGVINIILKKYKRVGFNGFLGVQYRYQKSKPFLNLNNSLDYKKKDLHLFAGYSYLKDIRLIQESYRLRSDNKSTFETSTNRIDNLERHNARFGFALDKTKYYLAIQTIFSYQTFLQSFESSLRNDSMGYIYSGTGVTDRNRYDKFSSTTLNYILKLDSSGSTLKVLSEFTHNNKNENSNFSSLYNIIEKNSIYRNNTPNTSDVFALQADYTKSFKNHLLLKGGVKLTSLKRDNIIGTEDYQSTWISNNKLSDHFIYNERLSMAYSSIEKSMNKTNIKGGIRVENTHLSGNSISINQSFKRRYFGLFPSVSISQVLNEEKQTSIHLDYSRRLLRPGLNDLNPNPLQVDNSSVQRGDPYLLPQFSQNLSSGLNLRNYSFDVYASKITNFIALLATFRNNIIEYQSSNFKNRFEYGSSINASWELFKFWRISNSLLVYNSTYRIDRLKVNQTTFSAKTIQTVNLKVIAFDIFGFYRSPYIYSNIHTSHTFYIDLGATKKILKGQGTLKLYCTDMLNTLREKETTKSNNIDLVFIRKRPTKTFSLTFNYNFSSGKKINSKPIDQTNADERSRF